MLNELEAERTADAAVSRQVEPFFTYRSSAGSPGK